MTIYVPDRPKRRLNTIGWRVCSYAPYSSDAGALDRPHPPLKGPPPISRRRYSLWQYRHSVNRSPSSFCVLCQLCLRFRRQRSRRTADGLVTTS
jgi:hypothetical protein